MKKTSTKMLNPKVGSKNSYINLIFEKYTRVFSKQEIKDWKKEDKYLTSK